MSFLLRTSLRDDLDFEYEQKVIEGFRYDTYDEARNECVPIFRAIGHVGDILVDHLGGGVLWVEIVDDRYGAVHWEMIAKDCTTLQALPF